MTYCGGESRLDSDSRTSRTFAVPLSPALERIHDAHIELSKRTLIRLTKDPAGAFSPRQPAVRRSYLGSQSRGDSGHVSAAVFVIKNTVMPTKASGSINPSQRGASC